MYFYSFNNQAGPTFDLYPVPKIMAPGGNVLVLIPNNGYAVDSGASFAAPLVAVSRPLSLNRLDSDVG